MTGMECYVLDWRDAFKQRHVTTYSLAPVTLGSLVHLSPMMATGFGIIVTAGAFAIIMAKLERYYAKKDDVLADYVPIIAKVILSSVAIGGIVYLVVANPIWKLW
jgi:fructose-specific phosphotransferase system IIC component